MKLRSINQFYIPHRLCARCKQRGIEIYLFILLMGLSACSIAPHQRGTMQDSAPKHAVDLNSIQNAHPIFEPYSKYGNPPSYVVHNQRYYTKTSAVGHKETGIASWYGRKFHGRRTSSGEPYNMLAMTAAHKTLPLPTYAKVTNLENNRAIIVKINDRGPFHEQRIIDLSYVAAAKLGFADKGTARVHVETITFPQHEPAPHTSPLHYVQVGAFQNKQSAEALKTRLTSVHNSANVKNMGAPQRSLYKVRLGPFYSRDEADKLASAVLDYGFQPFIVTE